MAKIVCKWAEDNKVYVDENGNVYPCCFWHHHINTRLDKGDNKFVRGYSKHVTLGKYNLKNKTLEDILMSDFYQHELKEHIEGDSPNKICEWQCGNEKHKTAK